MCALRAHSYLNPLQLTSGVSQHPTSTAGKHPSTFSALTAKAIMERIEATAAVRSLVYLSGSLAGLDVSAPSTGRFTDLVDEAFAKPNFPSARRPEAVANLLNLLAETLMVAQRGKLEMISESSVDKAKEKVCPVWPFD